MGALCTGLVNNSPEWITSGTKPFPCHHHQQDLMVAMFNPRRSPEVWHTHGKGDEQSDAFLQRTKKLNADPKKWLNVKRQICRNQAKKIRSKIHKLFVSRCKTQRKPGQKMLIVLHICCSVFYWSQVWSEERLWDLVSVESVLQTAGVWSHVPDKLSKVWRVVPLELFCLWSRCF